MVTLPPFLLPSSDFLSNKLFTRFGFDPKSDDYKVVKLLGLLRNPSADLTLASFFSSHTDSVEQAEIYSMKKGSWQVITQKVPSHITSIEDQDEVYVDGRDGHLHWLCNSSLKGKRQVILAFDFGDDTFSEIPLPDSLLDFSVNRHNVLGSLGGKLCVMSTVVNGGFEVWKMKEYGMSESWVKWSGFSKLRNIAPYGFTSHLEFCFQARKGLFLYDPFAAKIKRFKLFVEQHDKYKIVEYVDSLVWVQPAKCENSCSNNSQLQICNWAVDP